MGVIYGRRSVGRIYNVDNQLVSTVFFHLFFIPLCPLTSLLVARKGYLLDEGEWTPLSTQSVLASYLRHGLFAAACGGFAMMFNGLFLDMLSDREKPVFVTVGTGLLVISTCAWLWAIFLFGKNRDREVRFKASRLGIAAGLVSLILIMAVMFGTAAMLPKKVTLESIESDHTISDAEAIQRLAQNVFPEGAVVETLANVQGVEVRIQNVAGDEGRVSSFADQSPNEVARIDKAAAVFPMFARLQKLIQYGRSRHLSKISVTIVTNARGKDQQLHHIEAYRVSVLKEKFGDLEAVQFSRELLTTADKVLDRLGVVDFDHFSKFAYGH